MSLLNPTGPRSVQQPAAANPEKAPKKKIPAWKILVTAVIIVLSMLIVASITYLSMFGAPSKEEFANNGFFSALFKHAVLKTGERYEPTPTEPSLSGDQGDMPALPGSRKQKVYNFLVVGLNDDTGNNTDTIMLVQYDTGAQRVNVVQVPRDTYINASYNFHKINSIFAAGYNSATGSKAQRRETGMKDLCDFFQNNFAVRIDYSVLVDLSAFEHFIDNMGGLKVNVPCDMDYDDQWQNLHIHLKAGEQVLSGYDAMCMVRNRHTYADADYGRMDVQKIFLAALMQQVQQNLTDLNTVRNLINIAINDVNTNLSAEDCFYFASQALAMNMENLRMVTLPTLPIDNYVTVLKGDAINVINTYLNVNDQPITEKDFDPNCRLTDKNNSSYYQTYLYSHADYTVYDANEVNQNSIHLNVMR